MAAETKEKVREFEHMLRSWDPKRGFKGGIPSTPADILFGKRIEQFIRSNGCEQSRKIAQLVEKEIEEDARFERWFSQTDLSTLQSLLEFLVFQTPEHALACHE